MASLSTLSPVGEFVAEVPARSRIFERLGIDYCCGGKRPLAEVCEQANVNPDAVLAELLAVGPAPQASPGWNDVTLTALCDHLVATHHAYLRRELPRLSDLSRKVAEVHGPKHPEMVQAARVFEELREELEAHLAKEEEILFPGVRLLEAGDPQACGHCGTVANPIRVMEYEHDRAGTALATLRRLTSNYTAPPDACNTFRALLSGLEELEQDLHQHVHKENNILYPKTLALEKKLRG